MIFIYQFLYIFYICPRNAIIHFLIIFIIFILFIYFFIRALSIYDNYKGEPSKFSNNNKFINSIDKFFSPMEDFPFEKRFRGKRKKFLKIFGWVVIGYTFSIGVLIRIMLEFQKNNVTIPNWVHYFGFFLFIYAMACISTYFVSKINISSIAKFFAFGVALMIQVPIIVDQILIRPPAFPNGYNFIEWPDFIHAISYFFLGTETKYAVGWGHLTMTILLMTFSGFYVFYRSYFKPKGNPKRNLISTSIRTFFAVILVYVNIIFSLTSRPIIEEFLLLTIRYLPYPETIIANTFFDFFIFYIFIWLKIHIEESNKNKIKNKILDSIPIHNFISLSNYSIFTKKIDRKYKSRYTLKLAILFISFIILNMILLYIYHYDYSFFV